MAGFVNYLMWLMILIQKAYNYRKGLIFIHSAGLYSR